MAKGAYIGVPTPSASLGDLAIGSTIKLNVSGTETDFIVVHQGNPDSSKYDASCNGTWLLMKPCYPKRAWDSTNNDYGNSDISTYLNGDFFSLLDSHVRSAIKQVKIPYYNGSSVQNGTSGFSTKVFLLSGLEVGNTTALDSTMSADGAKLDYFETGESTTSAKNLRIAYPHTGGSATNWWLRSGVTNSSTFCCYVNYQGLVGTNFAVTSTDMLVRPAFILPSNLALVNGTIDGTEASTKDVARKVKKGYIGIEGLARKIKKAYIGVNGVAKLCWSGGNPISLRSVGDSVYMNVNGERKEFMIVQKGNPNSSIYDASCDGVWLLMKGIYEKRAWNKSNNNSYADSTIHSYLNGDFLDLFDDAVQSTIKQVKIPYRAGNSTGNSAVTGGANGLSTKIFLPSGKEVDAMQSYAAGEGAILSYFTSDGASKRTAYLNGTATEWWLRSPLYRDGSTVCYITNNGYSSNSSSTASLGIRPMLILPHDALVDDDGNLVS